MRARIGLALLAGGLVPLVAFGGLVYLEEASQERDDALATLTAIANIQEARAEAFEQSSLATARQVATRTEVRTELARVAEGRDADLQRIDTAAMEAASASTDTLAVSITGPDGTVVASTLPDAVGTRPPGIGELELADPMASVFRVLGPGQDQGAAPGTRARPPRLLVSVPVTLGGRPVGAVAVEVSIAPLVELATDHDGLGASGETLLATRNPAGDALIITPLRFDADAEFSRVVPDDDSRVPVTTALRRREAALDDAVDYRGEPVLAATRYLPDSALGLVVKIDRSEAYAPIGDLTRLLLAGAAASAVIAAALAWGLGRRLARPVRDLRGVAVRIGRGDTDVRADTDAPGELADLAVTINDMAAEIALARQGLEAEVAARTADLEDKLRELEHRNDELNAFASAVVHDLKSPLAVVKASVETVGAGRVDADRAAQLLAASASAADRMRELIDDLLHLARTGTADVARDEVHVADVVADVCEQLDLGDMVEVESVPVLAADRSMLHAALQNLIDNAATYAGVDGRGRVVVRGIDLDDATVGIAVDDDGPGIPAHERQAVFRPFTRGTTSQGTTGTGVGLAIVARIAERHGGTATADDSPLGGTRMVMTFPRDRVVAGGRG